MNRETFPQQLRWRPSWRIADAPLLFVDLETTGLYPERGHQITEAAIFDQGGLRYHCRCSPNSDELNDERAMVQQVVAIVERKIIVGHNIPFDLGFIVERCQRFELPLPAVGFIDTLGMARRFLNDPDQELTLEYVARRLQLDIPDQLHHAEPDARLARDVFYSLVERQQFVTLKEVRTRRFEVHEH